MSRATSHIPRVSVLVPLYNHQRYIGEALRSVLAQSMSDFELIVVDDGSTDNSGEIVRGFEDERISYYHQENRGAYAAINRALKLGKAEYIAILNSDDLYLPERLEIFCESLDADPRVSAMFSAVEHIDEAGMPVTVEDCGKPSWPDCPSRGRGVHNGRVVGLELLAGNFLVSTSNLFCRKEVFDRLGYFKPLRYAHDYDFFLRLCFSERAIQLDDVLLKYRVHDLNTVKENEAAVGFEVAVAIAIFLLDFRERLPFFKQNSDGCLANLLDGLNGQAGEKVILALFIAGLEKGQNREAWFKELMENQENPFRRASVEHIRKNIEDWRDSVKTWKELLEAGEYINKLEADLMASAEREKDWWSRAQEGWSTVEEQGMHVKKLEMRVDALTRDLEATNEKEKARWERYEAEAKEKAMETARPGTCSCSGRLSSRQCSLLIRIE
jgi:glycosyltransferase involved in cell wall biosynthesis